MPNPFGYGRIIRNGENLSKIVEEIPVNILKSEADGINGRRYLEDPMKMSDERFFGKWETHRYRIHQTTTNPVR